MKLRYVQSAVRLAVLVFAAAASGCASRPTPPAGVTFIVVRHAEKAGDGSNDPSLSTAGEERAEALAGTLGSSPLRAVYATAYRRTQSTAAPSARSHSLPVTTYDARMPAGDFAGKLRHEHAEGTVLVVGHSNTAASIAAALCECTVRPTGDEEYDRRIIVHVDRFGQATMQEDRY
jgi:broad specificity phosphatase PhoE